MFGRLGLVFHLDGEDGQMGLDVSSGWGGPSNRAYRLDGKDSQTGLEAFAEELAPFVAPRMMEFRISVDTKRWPQ